MSSKSPSAGLSEAEQVIFTSVEERDKYYHQELYGPNWSPAVVWRPHHEFHQMMFLKAKVKPVERLLLIGEVMDKVGLIEMGEAAVAPGGVFVPVNMRPLAFAHKGGRWGFLREVAAPFADSEFDGLIATQLHHCDEIVPELTALIRIVKSGRKVVLVENGILPSAFELAKQDAWLEYLLRHFVTWAGSRQVPTGEAYNYLKSTWFSIPIEEIVAAAKTLLEDVRLWEYKGMAMIDGIKP
jgi:hypothetical protein